MTPDSSTQLKTLRATYPAFEYRSCTAALTAEGLELKFEYFLSPALHFSPKYLITGVTQAHLDQVSPQVIEWYTFQIGLFTMMAYWKLTCSPTIAVSAGALSEAEVTWWHKLFLKGMGEFFFVNEIDFTEPDFLRITSPNSGKAIHSYQNDQQYIETHSNRKILIPIGGGKDSVVTMEILKKYPESELGLFLLQPEKAYFECVKLSGLKTVHVVKRFLDPQLVALETQGFLKGHIPFSAGLAFLSTLTAQLFGYQFVALSNERSANEGNVLFHGHDINHQYSKTYEFEQDFQNYHQTQLAPLTANVPGYFSFLRPLYELQIAQLFAQLSQYHGAFISCNRGMRNNTWCGECSKCLFAYLILSPFLPPEQVEAIFGQNLLEKAELLPLALELLGYGQQKPLDCVGTHEESIIAAHMSMLQYQAHHQPLPRLLELLYQQVLAQELNLNQRTSVLLEEWNSEHSLPPEFATLLKQAVTQNTHSPKAL